jgi:hypothetical protein
MEVENIRNFLAANYSDERLAALLAHTESGRLSYYSCCCLVGIPTATHALLGAGAYAPNCEDSHVWTGRSLPFGQEAELEFMRLGEHDATRRALLLPLIREEITRRETERQMQAMSVTGDFADVPRELLATG